MKYLKGRSQFFTSLKKARSRKQQASRTAAEDQPTRMGDAIQPLVKKHAGKSGVVTLFNGRDAFANRMLLTEAADQSLDIRSYIWNRDMTGMMMFDAIYRAAERGVRVRLLLDDNNTVKLDKILATLNAHSNIKIRLFNPFRSRKWRALDYLYDFRRLNRRMHNKSFSADGLATIVGGRNIGDQYFGAANDFQFLDLDVLAIGPVVDDVSDDFERYWDSKSSYPVDIVLSATKPASFRQLSESIQIIEQNPASDKFVEAIRNSEFVKNLLNNKLPFEWSEIQMVSDDPAKGLGLAPDDALVPQQLSKILQYPAKELLLVSPYLVPSDEGVKFFKTISEQVKNVSILTNAFEATDVAVVHAGYIRYRKELLKAGVNLFELKRRRKGAKFKDRGLTGNASASLHAKTFSVDRSLLFIGSLNFDLRSAQFNTEMGFVIKSKKLAEQAAAVFENEVPGASYRLHLDENNRIVWVEERNGGKIYHHREPGMNFLEHLGIGLLSKMPIMRLL